MGLDKRSGMRLPLHKLVDVYKHGSFLGRGATRDIHIDGAFVGGCPGEFKKNELLQLRIHLSEVGQKPVNLNGLVVYGTSDGIGILFSCTDKEFNRLTGGSHSKAHTT